METLINQLFAKYLDGNCTVQEKEMLLNYFQVAENESLLKELILGELQSAQPPESMVPDLNTRLNRVYQNVSVFIDDQTMKVSPWWMGWRSIAAVAATILIALAAVLYRSDNAVHGINPGRNAATLTLANGEQIILSDAAKGSIAKQAGVSITKTADGQLVYEVNADKDASSLPGNEPLSYNTLSTANGEQYKVVLPDGSSVILNAASSIKFPTRFARLKERSIQLGGEAYFSVKHNAKQPFKVLAQGQVVEDIGTEFNISAYADDPDVTTTLAEGSARVTPLLGAKGKEAILTPRQQSVLTAGRLQVHTVDLRLALAWKNGAFSYKNTSLEQAMKQIARWYNVKVVYQRPELKERRLSGSVSRYDKVSGILDAIEYTADVRFEVQGSTITVMKGAQDVEVKKVD